MKDNRVVLNFKKDLTYLAGYPFGVKTYNDQLKGKLDLKQEFEIVFPDNIEGVASSFVQGLFSEIVESIGLLSTQQRLIVIARNEKVEKSVKRKLA